MAKAKKIYACVECGHKQSTWAGICPECGSGDTLEEQVVKAVTLGKSANTSAAAILTDFNAVSAAESDRTSTGVPELDRVLGGGIVPGTGMVLVGEPGAGKTTMASEIAIHLSRENKKIVYFSGEESMAQVKMRLKRIGATDNDKINLSPEVSVERICSSIHENSIDFLVIDSVQTTISEQVAGTQGSVSQVKASANEILSAAKANGTSVLFIGQVLKSGDMAGPRALEHIVDVVMSFEGDRRAQYRILRANKNRFGSTDEVGVFEMTEKGLVGVDDVSSLFVEESGGLAGSAVTMVIEGSRPVVCEIQALVADSNIPNPVRAVRGIDPKKAQMLLAVLQRRARLNNLYSMDVYINVSGSFKIDDPGTDLAVCLAVASAVYDVPIDHKTVTFGEVSLLGLAKPAGQNERRIKEAKRLGYDIIAPDGVTELKSLVNKIKP